MANIFHYTKTINERDNIFKVRKTFGNVPILYQNMLCIRLEYTTKRILRKKELNYCINKMIFALRIECRLISLFFLQGEFTLIKLKSASTCLKYNLLFLTIVKEHKRVVIMNWNMDCRSSHIALNWQHKRIILIWIYVMKILWYTSTTFYH